MFPKIKGKGIKELVVLHYSLLSWKVNVLHLLLTTDKLVIH